MTILGGLYFESLVLKCLETFRAVLCAAAIVLQGAGSCWQEHGVPICEDYITRPLYFLHVDIAYCDLSACWSVCLQIDSFSLKNWSL